MFKVEFCDGTVVGVGDENESTVSLASEVAKHFGQFFHQRPTLYGWIVRDASYIDLPLQYDRENGMVYVTHEDLATASVSVQLF